MLSKRVASASYLRYLFSPKHRAAPCYHSEMVYHENKKVNRQTTRRWVDKETEKAIKDQYTVLDC